MSLYWLLNWIAECSYADCHGATSILDTYISLGQSEETNEAASECVNPPPDWYQGKSCFFLKRLYIACIKLMDIQYMIHVKPRSMVAQLIMITFCNLEITTIKRHILKLSLIKKVISWIENWCIFNIFYGSPSFMI